MNQFIVERVSNPEWADEQKTLIKANVKFACFTEDVSFVASPNDVEAHGRELFHRLSAGEFGAIGEYIAPPPAPQPTKEQLLSQLQELAAKIEAME